MQTTANLSSFQAEVLAFPLVEVGPSFLADREGLVAWLACRVVLEAASSVVVVHQHHVLGHSVLQQDLLTEQVPHVLRPGLHLAHRMHRE